MPALTLELSFGSYFGGQEAAPVRAALQSGFCAYASLAQPIRLEVQSGTAALQPDFRLEFLKSDLGQICRIEYRLEEVVSDRQLLAGGLALPAALADEIIADEVDRIACPVLHAILLEAASGRLAISEALMRRSQALRLLHVPEADYRVRARALLVAATDMDAGDIGSLSHLARIDLELAGEISLRARWLSRLKEALANAERALVLEPGSPLALLVRGLAELYRGRADDAHACLANLPSAALRLPEIAILAAELATYLGQANESMVARAAAALHLHPGPADWWRQSLVPVLADVDEGRALSLSREVLYPNLAMLVWRAVLADRQGRLQEAYETIEAWKRHWPTNEGVTSDQGRLAVQAWIRRTMPFLNTSRGSELSQAFLRLAGMD